MVQYNFKERFKNNLKDPLFSNDFTREGIPTAFGYMMKCYFIYCIVSLVIFSLFATTVLEDTILMTIGWIYLVQILFAVLIGLTIVAFIVALVINKLKYESMSLGNLYQTAIYSITVPNIILLPMFVFRLPKIIIIGVYGFIMIRYIIRYLSAYQAPEQNTNGIFSLHNKNDQA